MLLACVCVTVLAAATASRSYLSLSSSAALDDSSFDRFSLLALSWLPSFWNWSMDWGEEVDTADGVVGDAIHAGTKHRSGAGRALCP